MRRVMLIGGVAVLSVVGACDREPEPDLCPSIAEGDLVVSEIRGKQTVKKTMDNPPVNIADPYGEWVELYNASGSSIDLYGLRMRFLELDGSNEGNVIVRRHLDVAAGDRVVLSFFADDARPAHADYGWFPDFADSEGAARSLFPTGVVDLFACETRIDRVRPDGLPGNATWSFPVAPPDDTANDDPLVWCDDGTGATATEYAAGTPGEANRTCP